MSDEFRIQDHNTSDKSFKIITPDNMEMKLTVDFDDVNHEVVDKEIKALVDILNCNVIRLSFLSNKVSF